MSRATILSLSISAALGLALAPIAASAQSAQQALNWQSVRSPYVPGQGAIAGGPGDDPTPNSPMFICRAPVQGSLTPGKWVKGGCDVPYAGREVSARDYEVAYGNAVWRQFGNRNQSDLIPTGREANGTTLYSCRVRYRDGGRDVGYQPGKITANGKCDIAYAGREVTVGWPFEALYAGSMGTAAVAPQVTVAVGGNNYPPGYPYGWRARMPLCKMGDSDVTLVHGTWAGPNCIPVDIDGKPVPRNEYEARQAQRLTTPPAKPNGPRELCRKDDPRVSLTANGYAGPNCITSNAYGEPAEYGNATAEERARYKETHEPCKPGDAGVHVQNGMLVGADCKSVPETTAQQNETNDGGEPTFGVRNGNRVVTGTSRIDDQQKQDAAEKAAEAKAIADGRAASEEQQKQADAEAKAAADKAAQAKAEQEQQAAEQKAAEEKAEQEKAAALQKAADEQAAKQKEDEEKAAQLQKAFAEQAAADKAAAEQKAADEKAEQEKAAALQKAADEQAAKEKDDQEKAEALKKAFEEQAAKDKAAAEPPPPSEAPPSSEPASSDSDSNG